MSPGTRRGTARRPAKASRRETKRAQREPRLGRISPEALVVFCACPDEAVADRIARELVGARLAACINRLPGVRSIYRWQGALKDEPEVLLAIKTSRPRYEELEMRLKALHPYEVPEIIALPVLAGWAPYLAWLAGETRSLSDPRPKADTRNSP